MSQPKKPVASPVFNFEAFISACLYDVELRKLYAKLDAKPQRDYAMVRDRMKKIVVELGVTGPVLHEFATNIDNLTDADIEQYAAFAKKVNEGNPHVGS